MLKRMKAAKAMPDYNESTTNQVMSDSLPSATQMDESIKEVKTSLQDVKLHHKIKKYDENLNPIQDVKEELSGFDVCDIATKIAEEEQKEDSRNELAQLSEFVYVYPNRKICDHGNVFEGEIRSGVYGVRVCAIKFARKSEQNIKESRILTKLDPHTHVISIIQSGIYKDMLDERVFIALDRCHNQNLYQHITLQCVSGLEFNLNEALDYSKQIIAGMTYVHEKLIIHKDLKPSNILLTHDKSTIKLADFGLSEEIKSTSSKVYCKHQFGTNGFRPIESFGNNWVSVKSDIFSLGVVLYFVLSYGKSPFGDEISLRIHNTENGVIYLSDLLVPNANTFRHLIELMLSKERCRRPSIWQVADHPCWTRKEVQCKFDYGWEEEVDDSDIRIFESQEGGSSDPESELESGRELLRALDEMRLLEPAAPETEIIIFERKSEHLQRFNPRNKSMTQMHAFNGQMKGISSYLPHFSTVFLNDYIYVLKERMLYRLNCFDAIAEWERMADPLDDHGNEPPAAASSGAIYVAGSGLGLYTKSTSKYDPSLNRWDKWNDKLMATNYAAVVALNGYVYCLGGGVKGIGAINCAERLDIYTRTWDEVTPMQETRWGPSAVEFKGNIIVAGGTDQKNDVLNSVEMYSPIINQWTAMKPMTVGRQWFRCHSIEGEVYAVGGDQSKPISIEKYECER